jgi:opacity protein-like surface antigen
MRRTVLTALTLAAAVLAATAADAQPRYGYGSDNSLRFRVGLFTPEAESDYWVESFDVFTGDGDDFEDVTFGADFRFGLGPRLALMLTGDVWEGQEDQAYRDFVDDRNRDIFHTTTVDAASLGAGLVFNFTGPDARIVPYAGAGGAVYFWDLEESGDFIDFVPANPELFTTTFQDDGEAFGWFWLVGVEFPIGPQWGFFAEGRWHNVEDELSGDFEGLGDLDLSGRSITGGVSWRF